MYGSGRIDFLVFSLLNLTSQFPQIMEEIYSLRKSFSIIGITGRMGSGYSKFAQILSAPKEDFFRLDSEYSPFLRLPESINVTTNPENQSRINIFKRKYKICYDFTSKNWLKYEIIDYKTSLLLYCIDFYKKETDPINSFIDTLCLLFEKSPELDNDFPDVKLEKEIIYQKLSELGFDSIIHDLLQLHKPLTSVKEDSELKLISDIYFIKSSAFNRICDFLLSHLSDKNHYLRTLLFHRLANRIRSTGNPLEYDKINDSNIYTVARVINRLIKAYKSTQNQERKACHVAINSLKNSLEIMFFKERYSAFYMAAIHNDEILKKRIKTQIKHEEHKEVTYHKLVDLDSIEYKSESFSGGEFSAPDVQNCIQKSEIHVNHNVTPSQEPEFMTMNEQVLKYMALIQQPGIITPSAIERCMQIAFNAKLNSGCISRQVGAAITDKSFSIKSIGWNDVPQGSTPCLLRSINELIQSPIDSNEIEKNSPKFNTYSEFELTTNESFNYPLAKNSENIKFTQKTFNQNMQLIPSESISAVTDTGKNCSYCFKTRHNSFEGKENQVHTRSLHAEENAMLQIAKHGGQPLVNGVLFTTASPCELCSKKAYQLGVSTIIYIDPYPGISTSHILNNGFNRPDVKVFKGVIGKSYNKMYEPFLSYKDELKLMMKERKDK